jgi:hypothetical protein
VIEDTKRWAYSGNVVVAAALLGMSCSAPASTPSGVLAGSAQRTAAVTPASGGRSALGAAGLAASASAGLGGSALPTSTGLAGRSGGTLGTAPAAPAGVAGMSGGMLAASGRGSMVAPATGMTGAAGAAAPNQASTVPVKLGDPSKGCEGETMAPVAGDYSANGPLQTMVVNNTGPDGMFTVHRPTMLGANGFKHPVATWGNGITTDPSFYPGLLGAVASHGFVVVASNSSTVTTDMMVAGLDWMVAQNDKAGDYQGKLKTTCLVTFGYSLGGGASVGAGAHANVVATSSMHGVTGASNTLHAPLLLLTSETDTFVTPDGFVTPTFTLSTVPTFYGTLSAAADAGNQGHLIPVDGALSLITAGTANLAERAAVIAWLRLWVYGDQGARKYFYADDCILCKAPWTKPQRKDLK